MLPPRDLQNTRAVSAALVEHLHVADDGNVRFLALLEVVVPPPVGVYSRVRNTINLAFYRTKNVAVRRIRTIRVHIPHHEFADLYDETMTFVVPFVLPHPHQAEHNARRETVRKPILRRVKAYKPTLAVTGKRYLIDTIGVTCKERKRQLDEVHLIERDIVERQLFLIEKHDLRLLDRSFSQYTIAHKTIINFN